MLILPALGSIRRISVRTSVDLPEPERPMTTKTSPGWISIDTSRTATTQPVFWRSSRGGSSQSGVPMSLSPWGPNTFHTPSARTTGSPLSVPAGGPSTVGATLPLPVSLICGR